MSDAADLAYIDGVDLDDLNAELRSAPGIFSAPNESYTRVRPPFFAGAITTSDAPQVGERQFPLAFYNKQTTNALAESTMQTIKDAVLGRRVRLSFAHATGRSYYGTCEVLGAGLHAEPLAGWADVQMVFVCDDPYAVDDTWTEVSANAGERVAVRVGTGPTYPYVLVVGAGSSITITGRDFKGNPISALTTSSADTSDGIILETVNGGQVWRSDNGSIDPDLSHVTAGYTLPIFHPTRHANRAASLWPTLETSSGTLLVRYARRWK